MECGCREEYSRERDTWKSHDEQLARDVEMLRVQLLQRTHESQSLSQRQLTLDGEVTELRCKLRTSEDLVTKLSESNKHLVTKLVCHLSHLLTFK